MELPAAVADVDEKFSLTRSRCGIISHWSSAMPGFSRDSPGHAIVALRAPVQALPDATAISFPMRMQLVVEFYSQRTERTPAM
jgi:hypothetical protein